MSMTIIVRVARIIDLFAKQLTNILTAYVAVAMIVNRMIDRNCSGINTHETHRVEVVSPLIDSDLDCFGYLSCSVQPLCICQHKIPTLNASLGQQRPGCLECL